MRLRSVAASLALLASLLSFACADDDGGEAGSEDAAGSGGASAAGSPAAAGSAGTVAAGSAGAAGQSSAVAGGGAGGSGGALEDASVPDASTSAADSGTESADADDAPLAGWPDASNTGIPDGACPGGLVEATLAEIEPQSDAVIECVHFMNDVPYVRQEESNITYRYCRFESDSDVFLNLQGGPIVFEDSEFAGPAGTWIRAVYEANGLAVRRCDFSGMANAVEFGTRDVTLQDNYVHDFGDVDPEQHADGFQTEGASGFSIVHNTILFNEVWGSTSALLVSGEGAEVRDNLVAGGGYTIHVAGDLEVTGNRISTRFHPESGSYGPVYPESLDPSGVWSDNRWDDGPNAGEELPAP